jgi:peptidylprolyl isomerase
VRTLPLIPASVAVLGLVTVGLAGCSLPGASADCVSPATAMPTGLVSVTGDLGSEPRIEVYTPFSTDETTSSVVIDGEGEPIVTDDQLVVVDATILSGETGETLVATSYSGTDAPFQLSQLVASVPAFSDALRCVGEGSRVVIGLAPDGLEPETAAAWGLAEGESAVAVIDVHKVYLASATGETVFNTERGLPTIVRAPDGRPGIIVPDAPAPTETTVQVLVRGDGEVVTGDAPVRVHYTGVTWDERTVFDSTWGATPASLTLDGVVTGFAEALEGQTVGSQIMVVITPEDGYGDQEQGAIPANSTLVFVIDILGLDTPVTP